MDLSKKMVVTSCCECCGEEDTDCIKVGSDYYCISCAEGYEECEVCGYQFIPDNEGDTVCPDCIDADDNNAGQIPTKIEDLENPPKIIYLQMVEDNDVAGRMSEVTWSEDKITDIDEMYVNVKQLNAFIKSLYEEIDNEDLTNLIDLLESLGVKEFTEEKQKEVLRRVVEYASKL